MGFSLKKMIEELEEILASDIKASKKVRAILKVLAESKQYAKDCGRLE